MTDLERRCAHYLKSSGHADRIMRQIKRKYQSLGRVGGRIAIAALSEGECDLLRGILKRNFISG